MNDSSKYLQKGECGENKFLLSFSDMGMDDNIPARPILRRRYLLTCGIASLRPNTQITWFKDGRPFNANNDRVRFVDNKRGVLFTSLLDEDNGEYMCIANYGSSRASYTTSVNAAEEKLHGKQTFRVIYDIYNIKHTYPLQIFIVIIIVICCFTEIFCLQDDCIKDKSYALMG